jgi:hypothetical protein
MTRIPIKPEACWDMDVLCLWKRFVSKTGRSKALCALTAYNKIRFGAFRRRSVSSVVESYLTCFLLSADRFSRVSLSRGRLLKGDLVGGFGLGRDVFKRHAGGQFNQP